MNKITAIFLLTACFLPFEYSFAQASKAPGEGGIATVVPNEENVVTPDSLLSFKTPQGILLSGKQLDGKSLSSSYKQEALEAAKIDPGILIFPDSIIDAKILWIKPKAKVDPQIIVPPSED